MSRDADRVLAAIERWRQLELLDSHTAERLRSDVVGQESATTKRLSQYVLAFTGAVVLVIAGGVFVDWAWPLLEAPGRTVLLALTGVGVIIGGVSLESQHRWRPAAYLMQTAGLGLILAAFVYSEEAWPDQSIGGTIVGFLALATPIVLAFRAVRRDVFMPAVHLAMALAFLAVFLDRSTPLSGDAIVWTLDAVLLASILVLVALLKNDTHGERHPWTLNAFVMAMCVGFVLVTITAVDTLSLSDDSLLAIDAWLALCVALTLWGVHRAPEGLRRGWFAGLIAYEAFAWIPLGMGTALETFNGPPELAVILVGGVGVAAFVYAERFRLRGLMAAAALCFIVPVWWWAVDRAGAIGGVGALVLTAAFLFWASGRRGKLEEG